MENLLKFKEPLIKVGFTGTQTGMSFRQKREFINILLSLYDKYEKIELHHGDCVGADKDAHVISKRLGCFVVVHPPIYPGKRAFCKGNVILPNKDYIERNHDIVNETDILIVTPKENEEVLRSGTWATYRYAKKKKIEIKLIRR